MKKRDAETAGVLCPLLPPPRFNSIQIPREMWHMLMGGLLFGNMQAENLLVLENSQPPLNRFCRLEAAGRRLGEKQAQLLELK